MFFSKYFEIEICWRRILLGSILLRYWKKYIFLSLTFSKIPRHAAPNWATLNQKYFQINLTGHLNGDMKTYKEFTRVMNYEYDMLGHHLSNITEKIRKAFNRLLTSEVLVSRFIQYLHISSQYFTQSTYLDKKLYFRSDTISFLRCIGICGRRTEKNDKNMLNTEVVGFLLNSLNAFVLVQEDFSVIMTYGS